MEEENNSNNDQVYVSNMPNYVIRECEEIKIKYFDPDMPRLESNDWGDWIDVRAAEEYHLPANTHALIDLGFACKLPEGYEAHLAPRSSSFKKWGFIVTNSIGIIDNSYCGDNDIWKLSIYTTRETTINKYDRIAQFRIIKKQPDIIFKEVETLNSESRGGFGSTGVN